MKALKSLLILSFTVLFSAHAQRRTGIQDYASVSALQAETLTPQPTDKVLIKPTRFLYTWDANSTATHDGVLVIKQTNITTGRFLLLGTDKAAAGLGNVDNTSDANKPVSTATQTALNLKANIASPALTGTPTAPTAAGGTNTTQIATTAFVQLGVSAKENIITAGTTAQYWRGDKSWQTLNSTAVGLGNVNNTSDANKPVSTAQQTALNGKENTITAGTTAQYWRGDKSWQTLDKTAVGLGSVDNTSDANKPVSTATQTALNLKANLASPTFTGTPQVPTPGAGSNNSIIANTAFVTNADNLRVLSVDNVATLKTFGGVAGQIVTTKGYYTDGDGGGNTYYWNTTSTATENGGTIIKATFVTTGRWMFKNDMAEISVKAFGAKGDSLTNDTTPIQNALSYCIANSKTLVFNEGHYTVTNALYNTTNHTGNENLYLRFVGNVKITVPTSATITTALIAYGHNATTNVHLSGNSLNVNLNNKCKGFLEVRNNGIVSTVYYTTIGGEFKIDANSLIIRNVYAVSTSDGKAAGILSLGAFERVDISNVSVYDVGRHDIVNGECKGIAVQSTRGFVSINNCKITKVVAPGTNQTDADGIAVFGMQEDIGISNSFREGKARITNCVLTDNQGRSIKIQTSDATVKDCVFERKMIVSIPNTHDIDFQFGNGTVLNNTFYYRKNGATSPIQSTFIPVIFQNVLTNREQNSTAKDNVFYTEVSIRSPFFLATISGAKNANIDIKNNEVSAILTLSGLATLDRGFCEFIGADVLAMSGKMTINLFENTAFSGNVPFLAYSGVGTTDLGDKLVFRCVGNYNENTAVNPRVFAPISGSAITNVNKFQIFGNAGYSCNMTSTFAVNLSANKILPSTEIEIDLATNSVTAGPSGMTTAGYATIKVTGQWDNGSLIAEIFCEASSGSHFLYRSSGLGWKKVAMVNN